jgi:hypothetical protein
MTNDPYLDEAARILADIGASLPDSRALSRAQRELAEALQRAERRGREASGRRKESSG